MEVFYKLNSDLNLAIPVQQQIISKQSPIQKCCRICFSDDEDQEAGKLIAPCDCDGSLRFTHQECLKTWIVAQKQDVTKPFCEICKKNYKMKIKFGQKCMLALACADNTVGVFMITLIFIFGSIVFATSLIFMHDWISKDESSKFMPQNSKEISAIGFVICLAISLTFYIWFIFAIR